MGAGGTAHSSDRVPRAQGGRARAVTSVTNVAKASQDERHRGRESGDGRDHRHRPEQHARAGCRDRRACPRRAARVGRRWASPERGAVLRRCQKWVLDNTDRVCATISAETGKTYEDALIAEVSYIVHALGFWAKKAPEYLADQRVRSTLSVRARPQARRALRADRRGRRDRPVELPAEQLVRRLHPGARGGQRRGAQALRPDAAHRAADGGDAARVRAARRTSTASSPATVRPARR